MTMLQDAIDGLRAAGLADREILDGALVATLSLAEGGTVNEPSLAEVIEVVANSRVGEVGRYSLGDQVQARDLPGLPLTYERRKLLRGAEVRDHSVWINPGGNGKPWILASQVSTEGQARRAASNYIKAGLRVAMRRHTS